MTVPTLTVAGVVHVQAAGGASDCDPPGPAAIATTALDSLCVESSSNGSSTDPFVTGILKGDRIEQFKWLLNEDNSTGDPLFTAANVADCLPGRAKPTPTEIANNPYLAQYATAGDGSLADCAWPSVHPVQGHSDVIASGNQDDIGSLSGLTDGKYLISVTAAGYKIDGVHFEVAGGSITSVNEEAGKPFIVRMNPLPKRTLTMRVHVFNDNASTNGQWDGQTETLITCDLATPQQLATNCGGSPDPLLVADPSTDLSGFSASVADVLGTTTTDVFGNPLCTQYQLDSDNKVMLNDDGSPNPLVFADGGASGGSFAGTDSTCISDHYGDIVIPNMGPNRYQVTVVPPDPRTHGGDVWIRTTTLEGGHDWDAWNIEGDLGFDTELVVGGERTTPNIAGFIKLSHTDREWEAAQAAGTGSGLEGDYYDASGGFTGGPAGHGELFGTINVGRAYVGSGGGGLLGTPTAPYDGLNLANAKSDGPIEDGLVSISCIATCNAPTDTAVWTGRARADGTFNVTGLQTGDYVVSFWDEKQDYLLVPAQYSVNGDQVATTTPLTITSAVVASGIRTLTFSTAHGLSTGQFITLNNNGVAANSRWSGLFIVSSTPSPTTARVVRFSFLQPLVSAVLPMPTTTASTSVFSNPAPTDVGPILMPGWFTDITGVVFNDINGDGVRTPDEPGIPDFGLSVRTRSNSVQDQGNVFANTNSKGEYDLSESYPLGQFMILEAYNPRYKSTGFTYRTDNDLDANGDPVSHRVNSAQVDINFLPVIGLSAEVDWGVQAFGTGTDYWSGDTTVPAPANENGAIVGTVVYDTTRNEFDAARSAQEDYQPGVSGIAMQLWKTLKDANGDLITTGTGAVQQYGVGDCLRTDNLRGTNALLNGQACKPFDYYISESWTRPTDCTALDVNGAPLEGEMALPDHRPKDVVDYSHSDPTQPDCVEGPMSGVQIGGDGSVDGNYALTSLMRPGSLTTAPASGPDLEAFYGDAQNNPEFSDPLTNGDYVVEAVNPVDEINTKPVADPNAGGYFTGSTQNRLYRFTDETAINVFSGDVYAPQGGFSGPAAVEGDPGALAADPNSRIRFDYNSLGTGTVAQCAGSMHQVAEILSPELEAINPDLYAGGGNPFSGRDMPICDAKLVTVVGGRSMPAGFFMYTEVPLPAKFLGYISDDLNISTDRRSTYLGEVAGVQNVPVGVYDENGNWKYTAHSDPNGWYEVLLPSTGTYNCPLPAGPCANVYRLVGNDPGTLFHRNPDYNPQFRTIATQFQAWPGVVHPVDQAPTHNGITVEGPASQIGNLSLCALAVDNPVLFSISKPFYDPANRVASNPDGGDAANGSTPATVYTIEGSGFGASGTLTMDGASIATSSWSSTQITFSGSAVAGLSQAPHQLKITSGTSGLSTVNGLTFHRLSPGSTGTSTYLQRRDVWEVAPVQLSANVAYNDKPVQATDNTGGRLYTPVHDAWDSATNTAAGFSGVDVNGANVSGGRAIQRAIESAAQTNSTRPKLVVIYPNTAANYAPFNAFGAYFENVILHSRIKLQGVGPGGVRSNTDFVLGSNIDASMFWAATQVTPPGGNQDTSDGSYSGDWRTLASSFSNEVDPDVPQTRAGAGPAELPEGEAVLAIAESNNQWGNDGGALAGPFRGGVDGLLLTHGDAEGNPGTINTAPGQAAANFGPAQGGAITLDQYVRDFHITNNQIQSNGGTYGTIRIGTPDLTGSATDNQNDRLNVANNRIVANGGTALAGALGIYYGATGYTVTGNDFCGNFSAEYGGAISHYGRSDYGRIANNRVYYNQGYDEGGGIMIAGALPANNNTLSSGAGPVTIDSNLILANQSNDDGGGLRFLMAGTFPEMVSNNIIANNMSTHEGGGVALDDSTNVSLVNNTVVKNMTVATASTNAVLSSGIKRANPAGLSTAGNSALLQDSLSNTSPNWSRPNLLNNIFADNRAGWAELPTDGNFNDTAIHGIGDPADSTSVTQRWDVGVSSAAGLCESYNHVSDTCNSPTGVASFTGDNNTTNALTAAALTNADPNAVSYAGTNNIGDGTVAGTPDGTLSLAFVKINDFQVDALMWRTNINNSYPTFVAQNAPINLLADYHLTITSPFTTARNGGAASGGGTAVPTVPGGAHDIDGDSRPLLGGYDRGADEFAGAKANLSITKTDGLDLVNRGAAVSYTIVVSNAGPSVVVGAPLTDTVPNSLTGVTWSCPTGCASAGGSGNINTTVDLAVGASVTLTVNGTVSNTAEGLIVNTATVLTPADVTDPNSANNSATDTDTVILPLPTIGILDNFNRANSTSLNNGSNWSQTVVPFFGAGIRVSSNQALESFAGQALWNSPVAGFGTKQAAAFTFANTPNDSGLMLKASGGSAISPSNFLRVRYSPAGGGSLTVDTTSNGTTFTNVTTFGVAFASGDRLAAVANADGSVDLWKNSTYVGRSGTTTFTGGGRIGIQLGSLLALSGERVDDFAGGTPS
ncbi:MAG: hypothetical protein ABI894_12550 [Ilumatobacteraceae bacterium]